MLSSNDEDLDGPLTVSRSAKPENPRNPQGSRRLPLKSRTESDRFERKTEFRPLTGTKCKYSAYGGKLRNLRTIFHQILSFFRPFLPDMCPDSLLWDPGLSAFREFCFLFSFLFLAFQTLFRRSTTSVSVSITSFIYLSSGQTCAARREKEQ